MGSQAGAWEPAKVKEIGGIWFCGSRALAAVEQGGNLAS